MLCKGVTRNARLIREVSTLRQKVREMEELEADRQGIVDRLRKLVGATIHGMSAMVEARDPYTAGHQRRVSDLARSIGAVMNLSYDQREGLRMAASVHDIGKISVPAEILSKPTRLTELEFALIKIHPQTGYDILKDIEFPWPVARIVLEHHERIDGSGYPNGVKGEALGIESRILGVADVAESMASDRPYRPGFGVEASLRWIEEQKNVLFDPDVVDACVWLFNGKGYKMIP